MFGKPLELLQEKCRHEVIIFRKRNSCRFIHYNFFCNSSFLSAAKIESKNMFIFTLNLHQESLNAPC